MNLKSKFLVSILVLTTTLIAKNAQAQNISFTCVVDNDSIPTTFAQTPEGSVPVFKWKSNYFKPPYTPMQRCQEVSDRMNKFYAQGLMNQITSGRVNNQPVLCAGSDCQANGANVLITLRPEQSANQVLQELEANRSQGGGPSYQLTGGNNSNTNKPSALQNNSNGTVTLDVNEYIENSQPRPLQTTGGSTNSPGIVQPKPGAKW